MKCSDYLRLGSATIRSHKKRTLTVTIITGILFSIIIAGSFILQGLENSVLSAMTEITHGQVLTMTFPDTDFWPEDTPAPDSNDIITNVTAYQGTIVEAETIQTTDGVFYRFPANLFNLPENSLSSSDPTVLIPLTTASEWLEITPPSQTASLSEKLSTIANIRQFSFQKTLHTSSGNSYYVADFLPSGVYTTTLSFSEIGQNQNPLNVITSNLKTGVSQNLLLGDIVPKDSHPLSTDAVFALFPDPAAALAYFRHSANYCDEFDHAFQECGPDYQYQVVSIISSPIAAASTFETIWLIFSIFCLILTLIGIVIALTTYARLLEQNRKIITFYHASGATSGQIRLVFCLYLLLISLLTIIFSFLFGGLLTIIFNLSNSSALAGVFTIALSTTNDSIWLFGWHWLALLPVIALLLAAPLTILLQFRQFSHQKLR